MVIDYLRENVPTLRYCREHFSGGAFIYSKQLSSKIILYYRSSNIENEKIFLFRKARTCALVARAIFAMVLSHNDESRRAFFK